MSRSFIFLLAAIMLLLAAYWVKVTLFPTLGMLSVLGVVTMFVGHRALQNHAIATAKSE